MSILISTTAYQSKPGHWHKASIIFAELVWYSKFWNGPINVQNGDELILLNPTDGTLQYNRNSNLRFPSLLYKSADFTDVGFSKLTHAELEDLYRTHSLLSVNNVRFQNAVQRLKTVELLGGISFTHDDLGKQHEHNQ